MGAYTRYNQIKMDPHYANKSSFKTEYYSYCYTVIPYGLKELGILLGIKVLLSNKLGLG